MNAAKSVPSATTDKPIPMGIALEEATGDNSIPMAAAVEEATTDNPIPMAAAVETPTDTHLSEPVNGQVNDADIPMAEPVNGQVNDADTPMAEPVNGQVNDADIPMAEPVNGQVNDADIPMAEPVNGQVNADIPMAEPVNGQVNADIPMAKPVPEQNKTNSHEQPSHLQWQNDAAAKNEQLLRLVEEVLRAINEPKDPEQNPEQDPKYSLFNHLTSPLQTKPVPRSSDEKRSNNTPEEQKNFENQYSILEKQCALITQLLNPSNDSKENQPPDKKARALAQAIQAAALALFNIQQMCMANSAIQTAIDQEAGENQAAESTQTAEVQEAEFQVDAALAAEYSQEDETKRDSEVDTKKNIKGLCCKLAENPAFKVENTPEDTGKIAEIIEKGVTRSDYKAIESKADSVRHTSSNRP